MAKTCGCAQCSYILQAREVQLQSRHNKTINVVKGHRGKAGHVIAMITVPV